MQKDSRSCGDLLLTPRVHNIVKPKPRNNEHLEIVSQLLATKKPSSDHKVWMLVTRFCYGEGTNIMIHTSGVCNDPIAKWLTLLKTEMDSLKDCAKKVQESFGMGKISLEDLINHCVTILLEQPIFSESENDNNFFHLPKSK